MSHPFSNIGKKSVCLAVFPFILLQSASLTICLHTVQKSAAANVFPKASNSASYLLLSNEARTIKLSSNSATISCTSCPFKSSSPRDLKGAKVKTCPSHSATTPFSFASMSFSFVAEMHMSWNTSTGISRYQLNVKPEANRVLFSMAGVYALM